jgi:CheY-like chemotaxis protein
MPKVLLADDSATMQKVVDLVLKDAGYDVNSANDGQEALENILSYEPDIILVYIKLPGINGYEVAQKVKRNQKTQHIPVIMLAGAFEPVDDALFTQSGANDTLIKPFQTEDLLDMIKKYLPEGATAAVAEEEEDIFILSEGELEGQDDAPIEMETVTEAGAADPFGGGGGGFTEAVPSAAPQFEEAAPEAASGNFESEEAEAAAPVFEEAALVDPTEFDGDFVETAEVAAHGIVDPVIPDAGGFETAGAPDPDVVGDFVAPDASIEVDEEIVAGVAPVEAEVFEAEVYEAEVVEAEPVAVEPVVEPEVAEVVEAEVYEAEVYEAEAVAAAPVAPVAAAPVAAAASSVQMPGTEELTALFKRTAEENIQRALSEMDLKGTIVGLLEPHIKQSIDNMLVDLMPELLQKLLKELISENLTTLNSELKNIMWETVPELAEALINQELLKIKSSS